MGFSEAEALRAEVAALRARVARLEAMAAPGSPVSFPAPEATTQKASFSAGTSGASQSGAAAATPLLSFVPPVQPSLESRIGSQWFNRIGIIALLIGSAWFLKYAVDQQWLGPLARVLIGLFAGVVLIAWSERFRRQQYPVFSYSLKAVGTGMLYLTLWATFSLFHLVSYPVAFLGMVLITAANAWLCWAQRSAILAAYVAIGGFLTPALLAGRSISVLTLGSYLLLLNAGLFALMALRSWPRLLPAAFVGTESYLLGYAWHAHATASAGQTGAALGLVVLFFAVFSVLPALLRWEPAEFSAAALVAVANALCGAFAMGRLLPADSFFSHWLSLGIAIWLALLLPLVRARSAALTQVQAALIVGFTAVGLWTGLSGAGVVLGWALEASVLLLVARRHAPTLEDTTLTASPVPSAVLLLAAAVLLVGDSLTGALPHPEYVLLNVRFALYLLVIAIAVLAVRLAAREHAAYRDSHSLWPAMAAGSAVLATVMLLLAGIFELQTYWHGSGGTAEQFFDSAWAGLLGAMLLVLGFRLRWSFLRWQALALLTLAVAKVFLVDARSLSQGFGILSLLGLGVLLLSVSFIYQRDLLKLRGREHGE